MWQVSSDADVRAAVAEIEEKRDIEGLVEATLVFTNDVEFTYDKHPDPESSWDTGEVLDRQAVGQNYFSGVEGVTLTLKSADDNDRAHLKNLGATFGNTRLQNAGFSLNDGQTARFFTGPMIFDNIVFDTTDKNGTVRDEVYVVAQGHALVMTENFTSTKPLSVIGGNVGNYRRLDGMGYGTNTGVADDGSTAGWIVEKGGPASTHLELYGGTFDNVYAGGYNSIVGGDTFVKVALSEASDVKFVYGGGIYSNSRAQDLSEGTRALVKGDACVQALSGNFSTIYGGSNCGMIDGNSSVTVGQAQGSQKALYKEIYGGSNQGTLGARSGQDWLGKATVTVENTAHPASDTSDIYGGGYVDTINGTTEVILNGGSNDHWVFAGGMNIGAYSESANILNKNEEEIAAKITINGGEWREIYSTVETNIKSAQRQATQEIRGDVVVELNGGKVDYFSLSAHRTHVTGDSILTINGGELGDLATAISGYQYDDSEGGNTEDSGKVDGRRIVNLNNAQSMKCWQIYAVDQINVNNTAPFVACGTADEGALRSCGDVNIQAGTFALMGANSLVNTGVLNGVDENQEAKAKGDLTIAAGATLVLNATGDGLSTPGFVNAEGTATGAGKLLVVKPSGSDWICTDMSQGDPKAGEVYIRSGSTDETAASNTAANMVKLANDPTSCYVEYTQDASAIAPSFAHAWRIAADSTPDPTYTVTYTDGVDDEEVFVDQVTSGLAAGAATPVFNGTPSRTGYEFVGWLPEIAPTVSADAVYAAQWKKVDVPDPDPDPGSTYTVTYTDGVAGEVGFVDQVTSGLAAGDATPAFKGEPTREGYEFVGWKPAVSPTVTGDVVYTAQWEREEAVEPTLLYTVTYTDGVDGEEVFADQVTSGLVAGAATPAFEGEPVRVGYKFAGWEPEIAPTVVADATYAAQWVEADDPVPPIGPDIPTDPDIPTPDDPSDQDGFDKSDAPSGQNDAADALEPASDGASAVIPATNDLASRAAVLFAVLAAVCVVVAGCATMRFRRRANHNR